ncbi:hypothetical protein T11_1530, partial [Trichinella zimbabwensis]
MASAAKVRSKKLAANKDRLNRLLAELEELCLGSADVYEIEEQISMTEEICRASDALQAELELDLEGEERCRGTLSTNLEATEVIRTSEHAESCPVNPHAFYHHQQLGELRRLASEDTKPVMEIYDELASNASTNLDTVAHFPTWDQARHTMYNRRARRYPRLPATRQELRLTAEQTSTKSGEQTATRRVLFDYLPTYSQIFEVLHSKAEELGVQLDPATF